MYNEEKLLHRDYIGDGVYIGFDGFQIILWTQEGMRIALEDEVLSALDRYRKRLTAFYARKKEEKNERHTPDIR